MGQGDIRVLREQIDGSFAEHVLHASDLGLVPYELKNANFTAEAGKNYAVDARFVPAVYPTFTHGGLVFTAKSPTSTSTISWSNDGELYGEGENMFYIAGTETLDDIIAFISDNDFLFTVALDEGASLADAFPDDGAQEYTFSGGSASGFAGVEATLPVKPAPGAVIGFADARGLWGTYPLTVRRSSGPLPAVVGASHKLIEGGTANFTNNAAGTFFSMVFIDNTTGWRVLSSGTKPLNLTAPTVSGTYFVTATRGTWTGSPSSYEYQWQISDDGETGWANIEGATGNSYLSTMDVVGKFVRVGVVAINANGASAMTFSASSAELYIPPFPVEGLVAFYKMDNTNDASGNGYALTNTNGTAFETGKVGNAATFEGGSRLSVENLPWHLGSSDATFAIWLRPYTSAFGGQTTVAGFYQGGGFGLVIDNGTAIRFSQGAANMMTLTATVEDNEWIHVAFVKTPTHYRVYVNGSEDSAAAMINNGLLSKGSETAVFYFGDCTPPGWPGIYNGQIDGVGFWNRALNEAEIAQLYNGGAGAEL